MNKEIIESENFITVSTDKDYKKEKELIIL